MKRVLLTIMILLAGIPVLYPVTHVLTLEKSIDIAKQQSYTMLKLNEEVKIAEYNLKSATSRLKTHIDLNFTLPEYTETVRQQEDSVGIYFYPVKRLDYSGDLMINQPLPTNGNIFLQTGLASFDDFYTDLRSANLTTRIGLSQPIDAFYGYNTIRSSLKIAQLAFEQSNKLLMREEANLIYRVSESYYNLLSLQKSAEISHSDLERQSEAYQISQNKYKAGLIREVDALQLEVDMAAAQNNYDIAILNQTSAVNSFKDLLGLNLRDSVVLDSEMKYEVVVVNPDEAVQLALENRPEIREQDIQIEVQKLAVKQQKWQGMIKTNVNAYFEKVGVSRESMNVSYFNSVRNSYNDFIDRPANFGVGLSVKIPVLDWGENKALVRAEQSRLKQSTLRKEELEREIETEVRNLIAKLNSSLKRLQLLEKNVAVAEKSFEITRQRFSDGDIDSQSLALELNRLNTAYTSHLGAYINYQLALAQLTQKTFYNFLTKEKF